MGGFMIDLQERTGMDYGLIALSDMESLEGQEVELIWLPRGVQREESEVYTYSYGIFFRGGWIP